MRQLVPFKTQDKLFFKSLSTLEIEAAPAALQQAPTTKIVQQLLIDFYDIQHDSFISKNTSNVRKKLVESTPRDFPQC
jgi:hypothetical protein